MRELLCIGDLNADLLVPYGQARKYLQEARQGKAEKTEVVLQGGGSMGNSCLVLGRLGEHPHFVTDLCQDVVGRYLQQELEEAGVDFSYNIPGHNSSIICVCVLENRERMVFPWVPPGASLPRFRKETFSRIPRQDYDVLLSGMVLTNEEETMQAVIDFLRELKENTHSRLLFDLNLRPETYGLSPARRKAYEQILDLCDILLGSGIEEFGPLSGETDLQKAAEKLGSGRHTVIARNGAQPTLILSPDGTLTSVAPEPVRVLSTLGAGDTFNAAFLHAMRQKEDLSEAVHYATHCACYMISHEGRLSLPEDCLNHPDSNG